MTFPMGLNRLPMIFLFVITTISKKEGKDQESILSSNTPSQSTTFNFNKLMYFILKLLIQILEN